MIIARYRTTCILWGASAIQETVPLLAAMPTSRKPHCIATAVSVSVHVDVLLIPTAFVPADPGDFDAIRVNHKHG